MPGEARATVDESSLGFTGDICTTNCEQKTAFAPLKKRAPPMRRANHNIFHGENLEKSLLEVMAAKFDEEAQLPYITQPRKLSLLEAQKMEKVYYYC
mmetsp:Transcript_2457/g.3399  ORF Transcript_2457/g.3399 Transcript_2457/m.3399 type:complete len:97 (-) Transcript_2457:701-991(-)